MRRQSALLSDASFPFLMRYNFFELQIRRWFFFFIGFERMLVIEVSFMFCDDARDVAESLLRDNAIRFFLIFVLSSSLSSFVEEAFDAKYVSYIFGSVFCIA